MDAINCIIWNKFRSKELFPSVKSIRWLDGWNQWTVFSNASEFDETFQSEPSLKSSFAMEWSKRSCTLRRPNGLLWLICILYVDEKSSLKETLSINAALHICFPIKWNRWTIKMWSIARIWVLALSQSRNSYIYYSWASLIWNWFSFEFHSLSFSNACAQKQTDQQQRITSTYWLIRKSFFFLFCLNGD